MLETDSCCGKVASMTFAVADSSQSAHLLRVKLNIVAGRSRMLKSPLDLAAKSPLSAVKLFYLPINVLVGEREILKLKSGKSEG
jgi:hypothetical protein